MERIQDLFDNQAYQRENIEEAAQNLGIENIDMPRMPGMLRNSVFKHWQPVGINGIQEFRRRPYPKLRGCILADGVGLGKTWDTLGLRPDDVKARKPHGRRSTKTNGLYQRHRRSILMSRNISSTRSSHLKELVKEISTQVMNVLTSSSFYIGATEHIARFIAEERHSDSIRP